MGVHTARACSVSWPPLLRPLLLGKQDGGDKGCLCVEAHSPTCTCNERQLEGSIEGKRRIRVWRKPSHLAGGNGNGKATCETLASPQVARDSTLGHPPEGNENCCHPTLTRACSREPCRGQAPSGDDRTSTQLWLTGCNVDTSPDSVLREGSHRPEATHVPHDPVPTESPERESPRRHSTTRVWPSLGGQRGVTATWHESLPRRRKHSTVRSL